MSLDDVQQLTAEAFAEQYAARSGMTLEDLYQYGRVARPCGCGDESCQGWQMVDRATYEADYACYLAGHGPDPSHGADVRA